eukprot:TRINITY_DN14131_c0_g1_i1.p1 TRINITY_DN14131_c0_g1~~TRINITY_DN14131_c0_g1_i1.p1  ORF type:complete len:258 (-),score=60.90 TRINITY_DN14131_c0_g1_i1:286-945(-)
MNDKNIKSVSLGQVHTMILKDNGELYVCGYNLFKQLGSSLENRVELQLLVKDEEIKSVHNGSFISMIYKKNGDLFGFGDYFKDFGFEREEKLGSYLILNDTEIKQISIGDKHAMILKENGELWVMGENQYLQIGLEEVKFKNCKPTLLMKDSLIKQVVCAYYSSMVFKENGDLLGFGKSDCGQLGFISDINSKGVVIMNDKNIKSISLGFEHGLILKNN